MRELRALVDRLQALMDMHQQERNRVEALNHGAPSNVTGMVQVHVSWLNDQIKQIQSAIDDHIDCNPELKHDAELMRSIPGIGHRACAQFLAYIADVRRFKSAKALVAFLGRDAQTETVRHVDQRPHEDLTRGIYGREKVVLYAGNGGQAP